MARLFLALACTVIFAAMLSSSAAIQARDTVTQKVRDRDLEYFPADPATANRREAKASGRLRR
ncbi:hypothetical protein AAVH_15281, partial [Aphelenchoides avenae]